MTDVIAWLALIVATAAYVRTRKHWGVLKDFSRWASLIHERLFPMRSLPDPKEDIR